MHALGGSKRAARMLGVGFLSLTVVLGLGALSPTVATDPPGEDPIAAAQQQAAEEEQAPEETEGTGETEPTPAPEPDATGTLPGSIEPQSRVQAQSAAAAATPPYGASKPVVVESNFSRPKKSISSSANSDFSQLNDLERIIRGSYKTPAGNLRSDRKSNYVYLSVSRMENSYRVGRELVRAAKAGVRVRVIHGRASQSKESRALQKAINREKTGSFKICSKGKSNACLSGLTGAIMHSKILLVNRTYDREGREASGALWTGSANLGGPSGERTWNNGWTVYNDKKLFEQFKTMWGDMWSKRNIGRDYVRYVAARPTKYGIPDAEAERAGYGRNRGHADKGVFYSELSNTSYYFTPILASAVNGRDPVLNLLDRVQPDEQCRIYLQHNRFKYRRLAVAQKLSSLADGGCRIEAVAFRDDLSVNRRDHCQQWLRICKPILDELRTASVRIPAGWAKPHDKTMLVDAKLKPNRFNNLELLPTGQTWPSSGARAKVVQAGSASLTGSNLVVSDEVITESTDPDLYEQYLQHWKAINTSHEFHQYAY